VLVPLITTGIRRKLNEPAWGNRNAIASDTDCKPNDVLEEPHPGRFSYELIVTGGTTLAVMVDALIPKLTPLELENVIAERSFFVVPAETLIAWLAVTTLEFDIPNVTPFEFENTTVPVVLAVCVPAAMMLTPSPAPPPEGTEMFTEPFEKPTLAMPWPTNEMVRASNVDELDWPVEFPTA
jgi:hypothetical protein